MKAYQLLSDRKQWTKGAVARDAAGYRLAGANSPAACKWCAVGAIYKCYPLNAFAVIERFHDFVCLRFATPSAGDFNDNNEYETVVAALKEFEDGIDINECATDRSSPGVSSGLQGPDSSSTISQEPTLP